MLRFILAAVLGLVSVMPPAPAYAQRNVDIGSQADLADFAQGVYVGDVISDSRGSSRSGVTVRVTKAGPNLVQIRSDYARIPTVQIPLEQALSSIIAAAGDHIFVINREQDPNRLELSIDGASLSLSRQ